MSNNGSQPANPRTTPTLGLFQDVLDYVKERLSQPVSIPTPFALPIDTTVFQETVQKGLTLLPSRYHGPYVNVLSSSVKLAQAEITQLQSSWRKRSKRQAVLNKLSEVFSTLAAPIVQLDSRSHETELKAYLALASNLYQRFLSDAKIARLHRTVVSFPQIDPLGFFTIPGSEPGIWSPSRELPVALVSKPANEKNCLPLWVIDGHEVGGHGIYSHLTGFETEIAATLTKAVAAATSISTFSPLLKVITGPLVSLVAPTNRKNELAAAEFYSHIARTYSQEFAADIAGVLNLGPMFVNGLIIYLANRRKDSQLSHTAPLVGKQRLNAYPPDVLRALVAIEALKHLNLKFGEQWRSLLLQRLVTAYGGALPDHFSFVSEQGMYKITVPAADVISLVPAITDALVNSKLPCLADRSLREVLTWTELDEEIVEKVSNRLTRSDCNLDDLSDLEARHVSAAALHALEQVLSKPKGQTLAARIHKNGLAVLKSLYFEQCILCAVPTYGKTKRGNGDSQLCDLQDLLKLVRNFKSQR
jgi:hypothetical protein